MRLGGAVRDQGRCFADSFEAVPDPWRDGDQGVVQLSSEDFENCVAAFGVRPVVVADELDHPDRHGVVERHALMFVPGLDGAGVDHRKIDLAKALEAVAVDAHHMEHCSSLIRYPVQRSDGYTLDLSHPISLIAVIAPLLARQNSTVSSTASATEPVSVRPALASRSVRTTHGGAGAAAGSGAWSGGLLPVCRSTESWTRRARSRTVIGVPLPRL